ncbi:MAG: TrpR-related protein YerC/YecD [Clostridiales bacterium]|nr:TrpR-related protein YerC/YecD [Clostridiales bacterium]
MNNDNEHLTRLYETILNLKTVKDCENFFSDLCTPKELSAMAERLYGAYLLTDGLTYEQVIKKAKLSSATLSRISKCIKKGEGYKKFIKKG